MTPLPNLGTNSLSPPPLSSASSSGSAAHIPNSMHFSVAYHQPSPLPKPNGKEAINLISHWVTACHPVRWLVLVLVWAGWCWFFWEKNIVGWLNKPGWNQQANKDGTPVIAASHSWQFSGSCKNIFHVKRSPRYDHREMLLNEGALWSLLYCLISGEMIAFPM